MLEGSPLIEPNEVDAASLLSPPSRVTLEDSFLIIDCLRDETSFSYDLDGDSRADALFLALLKR